MNKENIEDQDSIPRFAGLRDGLIATSGTMGFVNFVKFSTVIWVCRGVFYILTI